MTITPRFNRAEFEKRLTAFYDAIEEEYLQLLRRIGEEAVAHAKNVPLPQGFTDRTANLRSSMGYALFYNGNLIEHTYAPETSRTTAEIGAEGARSGLALAKTVGEGTKGYALVVTAGMEYATYVEARGRDVLTSAESLSKQLLQEQIKALREDIKTAWQRLVAKHTK